MNGNQTRVFNSGTIPPDPFPSNGYANWVQRKSHFIAAAEAHQSTKDAQSINALPICLIGPAFEEFVFASQELKAQEANQPAPTLRGLFVHMDLVMGVIHNNRVGQNELRSVVQTHDETLREFARIFRSMGSLVFANRDSDERDELFREQSLETLT